MAFARSSRLLDREVVDEEHVDLRTPRAVDRDDQPGTVIPRSVLENLRELLGTRLGNVVALELAEPHGRQGTFAFGERDLAGRALELCGFSRKAGGQAEAAYLIVVARHCVLRPLGGKVGFGEVEAIVDVVTTKKVSRIVAGDLERPAAAYGKMTLRTHDAERECHEGQGNGCGEEATTHGRDSLRNAAA